MTLIHERVEMARQGSNPYVVCRVRSGWVVLGDSQFFRGYSLVLADPVVGSLNDLPSTERSQFLSDMVAVGDALLEITGACRINYEILGNAEAALHAHVFPRHPDEPEARRRSPVWLYDRAERQGVPFNQAREAPLIAAIRQYLESAGVAQPPHAPDNRYASAGDA
ncbi:MAG: hypothetical protein U0527_01145 [Candidatus Eisenbacteria bacterium]